MICYKYQLGETSCKVNISTYIYLKLRTKFNPYFMSSKVGGVHELFVLYRTRETDRRALVPVVNSKK